MGGRTLGLVPVAGRRRTAHEDVTESLRNAILGGALPGGTRLVQADIAAELGVSNTPVREAMRQLATEGLIQFDPFRGAVVRTPTLEEVQEVYELRLVLEPLIIRKSVERMTSSALQSAWALQRAMEDVSDVAEWVQLNRKLHNSLADAARSPRAAVIVRSLQDAAAPQVALSIKADMRRMTDGNAEHAALLEAIEKRDADRAAAVTSAHLQATVLAIEMEAQAARN